MKDSSMCYLVGLCSWFTFFILGYLIFTTEGFGMTETIPSLFVLGTHLGFLVIGLLFLIHGLDLSKHEQLVDENDEYYQRMKKL